MDTDNWFDLCGEFIEGTCCVKLCDKWNFIGKDGNVLSDVWLDDIRPFHNGFGRVRLDGKWNFIDKDGKVCQTFGSTDVMFSTKDSLK